jgi:hypothetical protein
VRDCEGRARMTPTVYSLLSSAGKGTSTRAYRHSSLQTIAIIVPAIATPTLDFYASSSLALPILGMQNNRAKSAKSTTPLLFPRIATEFDF